jgi:hypothetical protein
MGWTCNKCGKDNGGVESKREFCYQTKVCKDAGKFACSWIGEAAPEWTYATGQLSTPKRMDKAEADLVVLIQNLSAPVHTASSGTLVGGTAVKKGKKVSGLNDANARLDIQNSPGPGKYNLQYQIGDDSVACVLYTAEDSEGTVLGKLRDSLRAHMNARSPSFG